MFTSSARYYDAIYSAAGKDYETEAERLRNLIEQHKRSIGDTLLDVACGTGGHLVFLKDHFRVEGLDLDPAMLQIAGGKLPQVPLHQADMVDFSLGREFDVVVCLFSSIGYAGTVEKMKRAVMNMATHARPGGLVIVEPWLYPDDFREGTVHAVFVDTSDTKIARMNVSKVENDVSILDFHYLVATGAGVEFFVERHELALFTHEEYLSAFQAAELEVICDREGLGGRGLYTGIRPRG